MTNDHSDGFKLVSHKKKGRRSAQLSPARDISTPQVSDFNKETCIRRIQEAKEDILSSDFYESVRASLREGLQLLNGPEISGIVCFGLGRFTECMTSRYQFALLLLMKDLYTNRVSAYDPVFTNNEHDVLKHFNVNLIEENTEGKYKCERVDSIILKSDKQGFEDETAVDVKKQNPDGACKYQHDLTLVSSENLKFSSKNCTDSTLFSCEKTKENSETKKDSIPFSKNIKGDCKSKKISPLFTKCKSLENNSDNAESTQEDYDDLKLFSLNIQTSGIIETNSVNRINFNQTEGNCNTTIFFLPHCPKQLSNNLLWANWGLNLSRCIIMGNSFNRVLEANTKRAVSDNAEYLLKISPYVKELAVINSFRYYDIFNDTAIHIFPRGKLALVSEDFWDDNEEPVYNIEDVEFVRRATVVE